MRLDYVAVSDRGARWLSVVGRVRTEDRAGVDDVPALLPNLHVTLVGNAVYRFADGRVREAPPVAVLGPTLAAFSMEMSADYDMVSIGLLPAGWAAAARLPADRLADEVVDAAALWGERAVSDLWHAVAAAPGLDARRQVLEAFLHARAGGAVERADPRGAAVQRWLEQPGPPRLDALAGELDLSWRQVERLTLDLFGASPKALAMKYRALRAAGDLTWHGQAAMGRATDAYADQSHLIRDFRRFTGHTPGRFLRDRTAVTRAAMQGRWDAGVRGALALLS